MTTTENAAPGSEAAKSPDDAGDHGEPAGSADPGAGQDETQAAGAARAEDPVSTGRDFADQLAGGVRRPGSAESAGEAGPDADGAGAGADRATDDREARDFERTYIIYNHGGNTFVGPTEAHDIVSGGQTTWARDGGPSGGGSRPGRVDPAYLRQIRAIYIAQPSYVAAAQVLREELVTVVSGPAGVGKRATSLHLLSGAEAKPVLEIPRLDAQELLTFSFQKDERYVIEKFRDPIDSSVLERIGRVLVKRRAHLVITVDDHVTAGRRGPARPERYVARFDDVPRSPEVLASNTRWYLESERAEIDPEVLVRDPTVVAELASTGSATEVDRLARVMARVARGELKLEDALRRYRGRPSRDVVDWFQENGKRLERTALLISTAVLDGASFTTVASASAVLHQALWSQEDHGKEPLTRPIFDEPREAALDTIKASVVGGHRRTLLGRSRVELVQLNNPGWSREVVRHVWREYPLARRCLVDWLLALGRDPRAEVRIRAGVAVGELIAGDFQYVHDELLRPWARGGGSAARDAIRGALGVAAHGDASSLVLDLLGQWTVGPKRMQSSAATALGGAVALRDPNGALDRLGTMVEAVADARQTLDSILDHRDDLELLYEINRSVRWLFDRGGDFSLAIVETLARWSDRAGSQVLAMLACFFFLDLARTSRVRPPEEPLGEWPTVLWLMGGAGSSAVKDGVDRLTNRALALWSRSFRTAYTRQLALEVLDEWARWPDGRPDHYQTVERVVLAIIAALPPADHDRVAHFFIRAERNPRERSTSRERLIATLHRGV
jgi:hypothetical protein